MYLFPLEHIEEVELHIYTESLNVHFELNLSVFSDDTLGMPTGTLDSILMTLTFPPDLQAP